MKFYISIITLVFISSASAHTYIDSSQAHPNLKVVSTYFPGLFPKKGYYGGLLIGPAVSISGERLEIQIGIMVGLRQQEYCRPSHFGPGYCNTYRDKLIPFLVNYYFKISEKIRYFPSIGAGLYSYEDSSDGWVQLGGGFSYQLRKHLSVSLSAHEKYIYREFNPGAFLELVYHFK